MENATADDDWWADAEDVDSWLPVSALQNLVDIPLSSESISSIGFLPPPPRPSEILALEELGSEAFTSSCDLCSWAWSNPAFAIDPNRLSPATYGEFGWALTLVLVAFLSAVIGAVVTVTMLQCRRMKGLQSGCCASDEEEDLRGGRTSSSTPENQNPFADENKTPPLPSTRTPRGGGFWRRIFKRNPISVRGHCESSLQRRPPRRLCPTAPPTNENHYTVTRSPAPDSSSSVYTTSYAGEEALYAELERAADPAYQNTGYQNPPEVESEAPPSAPSSAYYSDLSCGPDRMYEAVGDGVPSTWNAQTLEAFRHHDLIMTTSLATKTVPSDYI
ncbi:uncharacterized protein LOC132204556 isoform X2 [Neocloeon triangulifer]|uniref:uncharacterized protein LOC132204556 isoform X2 n=1 Tax=Neocloeon triangulifer TaxID=2078957 RepID=UPI00286EB852|nr:uncharacterized protein LOC132204556 isoform X2 [Neocloeon triangulifer]